MSSVGPNLLPLSRRARIEHLLCPGNLSALKYLSEALEVETSQIEHLIQFGALYHNSKRMLTDVELRPGDYLRVHLEPRRFKVEGIDWASRRFHETEDFVIVRKPAGIPVHPTVDNLFENTLHQMGRSLGVKLLVTQRLDVVTQGLIVFAKTPEFQAYFNGALANRRVNKHYRALVPREVGSGPPREGHWLHYMMPHPRSPKQLSEHAQPDWLHCELAVKKSGPYRDFYEVEMALLTGRSHQIRAQLSFAGYPILGDRMYGSVADYPSPLGPDLTIALQAFALGFTDSKKRDWSWEIPSEWAV